LDFPNRIIIRVYKKAYLKFIVLCFAINYAKVRVAIASGFDLIAVHTPNNRCCIVWRRDAGRNADPARQLAYIVQMQQRDSFGERLCAPDQHGGADG